MSDFWWGFLAGAGAVFAVMVIPGVIYVYGIFAKMFANIF